jgi:uncharacterized protein (DUF983 family)
MNIQRAKTILLRGLKLRCPACGIGRLYRSLFHMNKHCSWCGLVYAREQGYFIGAIYVNVIFTEGLIFLTYLAMLMILPAADRKVFIVLFALAVILPLSFNRHARSIWLSFDYMMDPPEKLSPGQKSPGL